MNRQAEQVLGREPGDLLGKVIWDVYPGFHGTEFERVYRRCAAEKVTDSFTAYYPDHDRWYEVHVYPAQVGIAVYFRDVSDRKRSEEDRRALADRYEQQSRVFGRVLSSISDFAYTFDLDGRFNFINKPLLDLWGLTLEQAVGKNFFDLKYPDPLAAKLQRQIQDVIATKQRVVDETPYTSPSGHGGFYQYIFSPVLAGDGSVEAVAGSTRDITAHKLAEARDRFLVSLDDAIRPLDDPREITQTAARLLGLHLGVDRCAYADVEADQDTMNLTGNHVRGPEIRSIVGRLKFADFGAEVLRLMREDEPFVVNDIDTHQPPIEDPAAYRATQIQAVICVPLHKNGRFVASMAVHSATPRVWSSDEVELVRLVAARCWESIERARVARVLRESEERLRLATDTAELGIWVWDVATDVVLWENDRPYRMFGIPLSEGPVNATRFLKEFVHSEDAPAFERAIASAMETGEKFYFRGRFRRTNGEVRWCEFNGRAEKRASGEALRIIGTAADVTESKHAEDRERQAAIDARAAAEANAKFRTFFEQGSQFAGVMALDGTVIEANRLCIDACGFKREEVIGRKFWDCGWWNRSPALMEMVREGTKQAAEGKLFRRESTYFLADGSERFVDLTLSPVTDNVGNVLFIAPTGIDITEKKHLEDELKRLLAAERAARSEAETANRAKDRFLAVLSHELRTPLSPVVMTIPAIELDPELPFKFREDLAMVRRNIDLEVKLIDDLLDLSRVTSGKLRLKLQPVHAHEVLQHAIRNSLSDAGGKRLNVRAELNAKNDQLLADPARLQQVLWNLLRNAVKFTPEAGEIVVRTWNDGGVLAIEIRDNGIGIEPEVLPRIFDAFEQGEARMTRQFGGLGLGLAIAKAVVEMQGGTITAASAGSNQGAAFTVRLNTRSVQPPAKSNGDAPPAQSQPAPARLRILLVEDHGDTARTLARLLQMSGFEVKTAGSAAAALQLAAADTFDIVVSDIGLPDATGYDLMRQIRDLHGISGIALSGYGMEEDMRKSREAGFADHIIKPVDVQQLQTVIQRVARR